MRPQPRPDVALPTATLPPTARFLLAPAPFVAAGLLLAAAATPARASLTGAWSDEGGDDETVYGQSVHTAGDVNGDGYADVIIAAPGVSSQQSWVYVHHGSPTGASAAPSWSKSNGTNDRFGAQVATAGDVNGDGYDDVVVCTTAYSNGQQGEGRVDLFLGGPSGLAATAAWSFESNEALAGLSAAAYAGDVNGDGYDDIVIGCQGVQSFRGKVWLYSGNAGGTPTLAWSVLGAANTNLGSDVAAAGDLNADGYDDFLMGGYLGNVAYVVIGGPGLPAIWTGLSTPTSVANSRFGASVSTVGDANGDGYSDFVVGAPHDSTDDYHEGRVYLYLGSSSVVNTVPAWSYESNVINAELGASVSCAGDVNGDGYGDALFGAPYLTNGQNYEGRVMAFYGDASGLEGTPFWVAEGEASPGLLGRGLCTAGDVNGDGYADIVAGAPAWEEGDHFDEGKVAIWHGGPDAPSYVQHVTEGNQEEAQYGSAVALGDFDADGYAEYVVGAGFYDVGGVVDQGQVWIYPGGPGAPSVVPSQTLTGNPRRDRFGTSVDNAHDVNGDGYDDLIVGAVDALLPSGDVGGQAHVFHGGPAGVSTSPDWTTYGETQFAQYGHAVSWAGDVNGDGYADVLVGAPNHAHGHSAEGKAYVYLGGPLGLDTSPVWTFEGDATGSLLGWDVAAVGDVNRDGFGDIVVGAPEHDPRGGTTEGAAFVFLGHAGGVSAAPAWSILGPVGSETGYAVGGGDFDGDAFSDVIVGAPGYDQALANRGRVEIYRSDGAGLSGAPWQGVDGGQADGRFGTVVAAADFDLDGADEAITSQPYVWNGQTEEGQVLVYRTDPWTFFWGADGNAPLAWHGLAAASRGDVNGDGYPDIVSGSPGHESPLVHEGVAHVWLGNGGGSGHLLDPGLDRAGRLLVVDESRAIGLLGLGDGTDRVLVKSRGRSPIGRDHVALEVEVKPYGSAFDGQGTFVSSFQDTGLPGSLGSWVEIAQVASGLNLQERYRWRARHVSAHPYATAPWFGDAGNAEGEFDFRPGPGQTAVAEPGIVAAAGLALSGRPVPFRSFTTIEFETQRPGHVDLSVVDVAGRRVARLLAGPRGPGRHVARWDGADADGRPAGAGVYFAVVEADGRREAKRLVLVR
jgi:hypothetical protein